MTSATAQQIPAPTPAAKTASPRTRDSRWHGGVLLLCGVLGLIMAALLSIEKVDILVNPHYQPSCNINPVLSCGSVMVTPQASAFGFPNPFLGLVAFPVVIATAGLVLAGVALPRWWWLGMSIGSSLGVGFLWWLTYQTLYRIGALCPYCLAVWVITPIIASASVAQLAASDTGVLKAIADWRWTILLAYDAVVTLLIFLRFQSYWLSLL
jgi:uncharacterized membrane protein